MKLSVSMPEEYVNVLDEHSDRHGLGSRSAALRQAVRLLRASGLGSAYADAWTEWSECDEAEPWDAATADGLG